MEPAFGIGALLFCAFALFSFSIMFLQLSGASVNAQNYSASNANAVVESAIAYVNKINQSGYLIFTANLTSAYNYISDAKKVVNTSPDLAIAYANDAIAAAQAAYSKIGAYRLYSLGVVGAFTIVMGAILYKYMSKTENGRGKGRRRRR
ncbi:MAG: hypothetical protein QXZ35_02370 [Candidatus Micrarchaeaceae archaeon]